MSDTELPQTLADLLLTGLSPRTAPRQQRQHRHLGASTAAATPAPLGGSPALHSSLAKELSAVDAMFSRWQADVASKQRVAAAARDFGDSSFSLALLVLNKRGEVRRGTRVAQGWYFVPRQASTHTGDLPCSRCCVHIRRREVYFVDRAGNDWRQADEVCRGCMLYLMRALLGQDDAAILEEAQGIMESAWQPNINAALAEALGGQRQLLVEL